MTNAPLPQSLLVHGTAVALAGRAALFRGPPGSGKSDLALRLIDQGAVLVGDDQIRLKPSGDGIIATVPPAIAGLIEVRGMGLLRFPHVDAVPVVAIFDLVQGGEPERLPDLRTVTFFGLEFALYRLDPFTLSATAKVRLAVDPAWRDKLAVS